MTGGYTLIGSGIGAVVVTKLAAQVGWRPLFPGIGLLLLVVTAWLAWVLPQRQPPREGPGLGLVQGLGLLLRTRAIYPLMAMSVCTLGWLQVPVPHPRLPPLPGRSGSVRLSVRFHWICGATCGAPPFGSVGKAQEPHGRRRSICHHFGPVHLCARPAPVACGSVGSERICGVRPSPDGHRHRGGRAGPADAGRRGHRVDQRGGRRFRRLGDAVGGRIRSRRDGTDGGIGLGGVPSIGHRPAGCRPG